MSANDNANEEVVWTPGTAHPTYRVVAAEQEDHWVPLPGYRWADNPPEITNVVWAPGARHPAKNVVASTTEGQWEPAPGYTRRDH